MRARRQRHGPDDRSEGQGLHDTGRVPALRLGRGRQPHRLVRLLLAYPNAHLLEVNGRDGRLHIEDTVRRHTLNRAGDETAQVWQAGYFNDRERMFHRLFDRHADAFLAAFRAGDPPPVHARAGRLALALALAQAIIESFETGRRIDTTDPRPGHALG